MRFRRTLSRWPLTGLAAFVAVATVHAQGQSFRVAVVDVGEVFEQYHKKKEFDATLRAQHNKRMEVMQEKQKELRKLQEEVQLFDLGTDARKRAEERLYQKRVEYEVYGKIGGEEFAAAQKQYTLKLYEEIRRRIAEYAKGHQIDLVLKKEDEGISANTIELIQLEIKLRHVVYATPRMDITKELIATMNAGQAPAPQK